MGTAQLGAWFEPEFVNQSVAGMPVDLECFRPAPTLLQRDHEQRAQPLSQRVPGRHTGEFGDNG